MKKIQSIILVAMTCFLAGCATKLAPGGAYAPASATITTNELGTVTVIFTPTSAPDLLFYGTDAAFMMAYSIVDAAFKFERDNRAMLWKISPDIKHGLDKLRPEATLVKRDYINARAEYVKNPIPPNLTLLEGVLTRANRLAASIAAVLPKGN